MGRRRDGGRALRVLVTGAAGFIGWHLCGRLLEDGHAVWGLDNFDADYDLASKRGRADALAEQPCMHVVEGDVRDGVLLDGLFTSVPFDLVVHLAARPGERASQAQPELCWDVNVTGTLRLLEAMRRRHVGRLVFASSAAVYGAGAGEEIASSEEDTPADAPLSPYAASKRSAELLCRTWHHLWGLSVHCLRLFDVYGPEQRPDLPVAVLASRLRAGHRITVYGEEDAVRDFIYVSDVVEGFGRSIDVLRGLPPDEPTWRVLNLGRGRPVGVDELVDVLAGALGATPRISKAPARRGVAPRTLARVDEAERVLGFRARVDLPEGIERTVAWLSARAADTPVAAGVLGA